MLLRLAACVLSRLGPRLLQSLFSPQALLIAACFPKDWPLLIVCPATMRLVWADAVRTWLPPELRPQASHLLVVNDGKVGGSAACAACTAGRCSRDAGILLRSLSFSFCLCLLSQALGKLAGLPHQPGVPR